MKAITVKNKTDLAKLMENLILEYGPCSTDNIPFPYDYPAVFVYEEDYAHEAGLEFAHIWIYQEDLSHEN